MIKKVLLGLLSLMAISVFSAAHAADDSNTTVHYRTVQVEGLSIFYREAGPANAPTVLLLHGFPSSSRMYEPLLSRLSSKYHVIAPDYPGFGHSEAPSNKEFSYTFDHLAKVMTAFTEQVGLKSYAMYMQDYGGPVGMRMAIAHPERVKGFVIQNVLFHEEGHGPVWKKRREFWADREANEAGFRAAFLSPATTKQRHIGSNPNVESIDPDRWTDDYAFLSRPGQADIQTDLFYDYSTNLASYPAWGEWLRKNKPKSLIVWGRYDPSFQIDEVAAYVRDVPKTEVHIVDGGHFALNDRPEEIAGFVKQFLDRTFSNKKE